MLPMHPLQMPQRHMRIYLRRRNIRMPQQSLHTPQIRSMLHHMRSAAMPQLMRTGLTPTQSTARNRPHHLPNPLPRQGIPPHTQKQLPPQQLSRPHQPRPSQRQISFQRLDCSPTQRHNPLLISLASHLHPPLIQMHILHSQRHNLSHPQPAAIKQLQNRVIPQRQPIRIRTSSRHARPPQHLGHLTLSQRLRQHLPALRTLHIHRRIFNNPLIHQQPAIKPTQTTQLPRNRPRLHRMPAQPLHKSPNVNLSRPNQQPIPPLNMLRKLLQIPLVSLTTSRPQPLLHPQISHILPNHPRISIYLALFLYRSPHKLDYPAPTCPQTGQPAQ